MTETKKGTKWSKEEDEQLIDEIKNSMEISIIATNHCRTNTAILFRIYQHVYNMINTNQDTIDNIAKYVKIPLEQLKTGVEK